MPIFPGFKAGFAYLCFQKRGVVIVIEVRGGREPQFWIEYGDTRVYYFYFVLVGGATVVEGLAKLVFGNHCHGTLLA